MKLLEALNKTTIVLGYLLRHPQLVRKLHAFLYKGYLLEAGWIKSAQEKRPVNAKGSPLPWLTYPIIDFLEERLRPDLDIFEFGGGNSTLYFSSRVKSVKTVEHNREWFDYLKNKIPSNCTAIFQELQYDGAYCRAANAAGEQFDVILIDGRDRVNCARHAVKALSPLGVIIFDDFQRDRYQEAAGFLANGGFQQLNFFGIKPGFMERSNSALFYRQDNVFGL